MNNENRAESILAIMPDFKLAAGLRGEPDAEVIGDLLCNLAHWCDAEECDIAIALDRAICNYEAETNSRGLQFEEIAEAFKTATMARQPQRIVVHVHGGNVQQVFASDPRVQVEVIDMDNLQSNGMREWQQNAQLAHAVEGLNLVS